MKRLLSYIVLIFLISKVHASTQVAVGSYDDLNSNTKPLVAVNLKMGWTAIEKISGMPASLKPLFALTAHCSGNHCIIGGGGVFDNTIPYLAVSQDEGNTWFYPTIIGFSTAAFNTEIKSTYCIGAQCMAVGSYHEYKTCNIPLFLSSQDSGLSWKSVAVNKLPRIKLDCVEPKFISCGNGFCVVAGNYVRDFGTYAMLSLFLSFDEGKSWKYIDSKEIANLPSGFKNSDLVAGNCVGNACTLMGSYNKHNDYTHRYPLILTSKDAGRSWTFVENPKNLPENIDVRYTYIDCSEERCVATGVSTDHNISQSFIVFSTDRLTWQKVDLNNILNYEVSEFSALKCTENTCIVATSSRKPDLTEFFFLTSDDRGVTWQRVENVNGIPNQNAKNLGMIYNIQCENKTCFAAGYYLENYQAIPLLLSSNDAGQSWQFVPNLNMPKFKEGVFYQLNV